jgi:hypothetical protein
LNVPVTFAQGFTGPKTAGSHVLVSEFMTVPVGQPVTQVPKLKNDVAGHDTQEVALGPKQVAQTELHG